MFGESRQFPGAGSPLRSAAGLEEVLDKSCDVDVEDELVPELDDNPVTTRGSKFSVFNWVSHPCLVKGFFFLTAGPLRGVIRVLRRVLQVIEMQACHRVFAPSRIGLDRERKLLPPRGCALHYWQWV